MERNKCKGIGMIYITGDTHRNFTRIAKFCHDFKTTKKDILVILGDAGINYYGKIDDDILKGFLSALPITLFCIHGNHENRPSNIKTYKVKKWNGGKVYVEKDYPNLIFAKDGEIYNFDGTRILVIGGAYSVDKRQRITFGYNWWEDEQPSEEIKKYVEKNLEKNDWDVDIVLSHTVPLKYEPIEVFLPGIDQSKVDKSTEIWMDNIEEKLSYKKWYAGHYHTEKIKDKLRLMFNDIEELKLE